MSKRSLFVSVLLVLIALIISAFYVQAPSSLVVDHRYDYPCQSPKFLPREQAIDVQVSVAELGARWPTGCRAEAVAVPEISVPQSFCPAGTTPLFTTPGRIDVGTVVAGGGVVTSVKGEWYVEWKGDTLLATAGRSITIVFPEDVYVEGVLVFDNDPKDGQLPWRIDGKPIPTTPNDSWGPMFKIYSLEGQLDFENGNDSPHFNVCVRLPG